MLMFKNPSEAMHTWTIIAIFINMCISGVFSSTREPLFIGVAIFLESGTRGADLEYFFGIV